MQTQEYIFTNLNIAQIKFLITAISSKWKALTNFQNFFRMQLEKGEDVKVEVLDEIPESIWINLDKEITKDGMVENKVYALLCKKVLEIC